MITVTEHAKNILRMALASTGIENPKIRLRLNPAALASMRRAALSPRLYDIGILTNNSWSVV